MTEESVIKRKLMFDGDGTGEDKKIMVFMKLLPKYILGGNNNNSNSLRNEATYNNLLAQLESIITSRRKSELTTAADLKQKEIFCAIQTTYQEYIENIKMDIVKQKQLLELAKIVKQHNIEYELLAQTVNREPSRKEIEEKMKDLMNEIENLEKEKELLDQKLDCKVKQCYVLSTSANTLKSILKDDNIDCENYTNSSIIIE